MKNRYLLPVTCYLFLVLCFASCANDTTPDTPPNSNPTEKAYLNVDKVFLYTDETEGGAADLTLNPQYVAANGGYGNFSVEFTLYDGESDDAARTPAVTGAYNEAVIAPGARVIQTQTVSFSGTVTAARFIYNKEMLAKQKHKYTLVATVRQGNTTLDTFKQNLYVYPRPSIVKVKDGKFSHYEIDGEVFNPVVGYGLYDANYEYARQAGVNVAQTGMTTVYDTEDSQFNYQMEMLKRYGIKGIVPVDGCWNGWQFGEFDYFNELSQATVKRIVNKTKGYSQVFAYFLGDEPFTRAEIVFGGRAELEKRRLEMEEGYRLIRDIDEVHPIWIVDNRQFPENVKYCDILELDTYPARPPTTETTQNTPQALAAANKQGKPVANLSGAYWFEVEETGGRGKGTPTGNVIRNIVYRAFEAGASSVGYFIWAGSFRWQDGRSAPLHQTELYAPVCVMGDAEIPLLFDLFVNNKVDVLYQSGEGNNTTSLFVRQWVSRTDGKTYLLCHNRSMNTVQTGAIALRNASGGSFGAYTAMPIGLTVLTKPDAVTGTGDLSLSLGPEEIALFEIVSGSVQQATAVVNVTLNWQNIPVNERPSVTFTNGYREGRQTVGEGWKSFEAQVNGESGVLVRSVQVRVDGNSTVNNNPVSFKAEGGKTYEVEFVIGKPGADTRTENLLPNGDFENANNTTGMPGSNYEYSYVGDSPSPVFVPGGMVSFVTDPSHPERGQVMRLTYNGGTALGSFNDSGQLISHVQLYAGATYRMSGLMKLDAAHSGDGIPCMAIWDSVWGSPPGGDYANKLPAVKVKGEWEPFEFVFTASVSDVYYLTFFFGNSSNLSLAPNATDGAVYFDDIAMYVME